MIARYMLYLIDSNGFAFCHMTFNSKQDADVMARSYTRIRSEIVAI
jgi:hypothetical protein